MIICPADFAGCCPPTSSTRPPVSPGGVPAPHRSVMVGGDHLPGRFRWVLSTDQLYPSTGVTGSGRSRRSRLAGITRCHPRSKRQGVGAATRWFAPWPNSSYLMTSSQFKGLSHEAGAPGQTRPESTRLAEGLGALIAAIRGVARQKRSLPMAARWEDPGRTSG